MLTLALAAVRSFALLGLALAPCPQEKHARLGLSLDVPGRYAAIPVQPTEPWIVLHYVGEKNERKKDAPSLQPRLYVVRLEAKAEPEAPAGFADYLGKCWSSWKIEQEGEAAAREGWTCKEYELRPDQSTSSATGWAHEFRGPERTWVLMGLCAASELEKERRVWRQCAKKLEFFEPIAPPNAARWAKTYERNPQFRNPELRLRIRANLVEGWEAEDSENYILVYSTKKDSLIQHLKKRLEAIRRTYLELFPPVAEITAVSTVRICKDREEYGHYGGSASSAGYWNYQTEELVLFVFDEKDSSTQAGKEDARTVLFHEAFHQYIHYAAGELAPHSWFNEGYGDYFSGAEFDVHGDVSRIHVNSWRVEWIQQAIRTHAHASWREMGWMEKAEYYGPNRSIHYAMGWSMVYFLNECKEVRKHPAWGKILPTYFETLKEANASERATLAAAGLEKDEEALAKAMGKAREKAASAAFADVDLTQIEEAWREFTLELKPPKK